MVSVVKRPQGHKLIDQSIAAEIIESYEGDALVSFPYHALTTGDTVYIESDIDQYNGFWYVTVVTPDSFKISDHSEADFVEFYQEVEIDYYQTQPHDWSAIFLPIIYKISNDLWPINSSNPERTILSFSDDNGFTNLVLSGALRSNFRALEFVKIDDEVFQIVEVISTSEIVINLAYDASLTLSTAQYYYNNYQVHVKIFAGLPADHPWEHKKPYEEMAELSLTPDENNEVMFSVSDYIQSKVKIENNLTLFSLPLNLDAFTGFYISVSESFDQSDSYSLYSTEAPFVDDTFEGYAVAGKLPFKNLYAGDYADYVYTSGSPARWLTVFERLLGVEGYYFDISFIKNTEGAFHVTINKYLSDYAIQETLEFVDFGIGVYRIPLTLDSAYDSFCIQAVTEEHEEEVPPETLDLSTMDNGTIGGATLWNLGDMPYTTIVIGTETLWVNKVTLNGNILKVNYTLTISSGNAFVIFSISSSINVLDDDQNIGVVSTGVHTGSINLTATADRAYFMIYASGDATIAINSISFGDPSTITVPGATVTEEICIDILEACQVEDGFIPEGRRLTEDGGFRLLE